MISNDTIYALSSAAGRAGIAVVRLSGPAAGAVLTALTGQPGQTGQPGRPGQLDRVARVRALRHPAEGGHLDTALVLGFAGPNSVTGEDVVELHVHGGRAVVEAVLDGIAATGMARMAEAGEFTRRAFDAGKLDLTEVEGLADLIDAETEAQRRQALGQFGGALGALYGGWRERLVGALAHLEAGIDFIDEDDVPVAVDQAVRPVIEGLIGDMAAHLDDARRGEILRDGVAIAIVGPPNAGKSSVLNELARRDVAIVGTTAGTTRDVIQVNLDLGGYAVILFDTAGLRAEAGADEVEIEGMRRARAVADAADLRLCVIDGTDPDAASAIAGLPYDLLLVNKADLDGWRLPEGVGSEGTYAVSARTGTGFSDVLARVAQIVARLAGTHVGPVLTRTRHRQAISTALEALRRSQTAGAVELAAEDLRQAATLLGQVVGAVDVEDLLDVMFRDFCIGK